MAIRHDLAEAAASRHMKIGGRMSGGKIEPSCGSSIVMDAVSGDEASEARPRNAALVRDSSTRALARCRECADDWRTTSDATSRAIPASGIASRTIMRVILEAFLSIALLLRHFTKHRYGFDFDQQFGTTQFGLNAGRCGQGVETLFVIEGGALFVELRVVAIDVAQVAGGADDILPGSALGSEQRGNILESAAALRAEISDVNGGAVFVNAGGAGGQQHDRAAAEINAYAARERAGFGVMIGLVEDAMVGDCTLRHGFDCRLLRGFFDAGHGCLPKQLLVHQFTTNLSLRIKACAATLKIAQPQPATQFPPRTLAPRTRMPNSRRRFAQSTARKRRGLRILAPR